MPSFIATSPDGQKFKITAPEGATQEQMTNYAEQMLAMHKGGGYNEGLKRNDPGTPNDSYYAGSEADNNAPAGGPSASPHAAMPESASGPAPEDTETYFDIPSLSFKQRPGNSMAAFGGGAIRFARGVGNLAVKGLNKVLPGDEDKFDAVNGENRAIQGGFFSNESVREQDRLDQALRANNPAMYQAGELAPTLPVNAGLEAGVSAARGAAIVGRPLAQWLAKQGLTGAVDAASVGDVDKLGKEAATGAGTNLVLGAALGSLGRTASGVVQKSKAAEDLEHLASQHGEDMFVPLGLAGDAKGDITSRLTQTLYREGLPLIPGVESRLRSQQADALSSFRQMALEEGDATGNTLAKGASEDGLQAKADLEKSLENQYKTTVGSYSFNVPKDIPQQVEARVRAAMPNVDDTTLKKVTDRITGNLDRYSNGQPTIEGENLLNAKNEAASKSGLNPIEQKALDEGHKVFDDMIEDQLKHGGSKQNLADLQRYQETAEPASALGQVGAAADAAKLDKGQFTPAQLAAKTTGPGPVLHLAQSAEEVLGKPVAKPSTTGKVLAYSLGAYGGFTHPGAAAAMVAGGNVMATKVVQRALMGDTAAQQALQGILKSNPKTAHYLKSILYAGAPEYMADRPGESNGGP